MEFNDEELEEITRMGAAAFTPGQSAFALGYPVAKFIEILQDDNHPAALAYFKGFYSSELAVRESVMLLARSGSSPAQTLGLKYFDETRKRIMKDGNGETEI
ncbi:MAG: hypothetical protein M0Q26_05870 [Chitinophagaceae bacterium]|nr:hypothetical protein [Chitinophagaceae bacterium]MDP1763410.1 hypothetical protein [Sediminibacterium sp.]